MPSSPYRKNVGAVIRGILNGVKHTPQTISSVLGINQEKLEKIVRGEAELTEDIEKALISFPGINQRDFYSPEDQYLFPVVDDTDGGVVILRAQDTLNSRRTLTRGPQDIPYYIYADTAMSNISTFRPEWIKELYVYDGESVDELPDWTFNKGHFEHQITYFIGPVNFYWMDKAGKRHVCRMNTGDTNYIVPFVPHTFTTRRSGEGLILAVTYGGAISNPDFRSKIASLSVEEFLQLLKRKLPSIPEGNIFGGIGVLKHSGAPRITSKSFDTISLINPDCQPATKATELIIKGANGNEDIDGCYSSDRWGYNLGDSSVVLRWGDNKKPKVCLIEPGDSFFIKPGTVHTFRAVNNQTGKLLVIDIKPQEGDPNTELALIEKYAGDNGLKRVHTETTRWY